MSIIKEYKPNHLTYKYIDLEDYKKIEEKRLHNKFEFYYSKEHNIYFKHTICDSRSNYDGELNCCIFDNEKWIILIPKDNKNYTSNTYHWCKGSFKEIYTTEKSKKEISELLIIVRKLYSEL